MIQKLQSEKVFRVIIRKMRCISGLTAILVKMITQLMFCGYDPAMYFLTHIYHASVHLINNTLVANKFTQMKITLLVYFIPLLWMV